MAWAQLIIGPPGSGKTHYAMGMHDFLTALGRDVAVVNLDPANYDPPYPCALDISELISLEDAMAEMKLGPNGGLLYCIEYLAKNLDWLKQKLAPLERKYILFDCPGQVELYTIDPHMKTIVEALHIKWNYRLAAVHLVDAHHCTDPAKFISVLMVSLSTMCHLELPHVNVLSKMDLIESYGKLAFGLDFYTDVGNLDYIIEHINQNPLFAKHRALTKAIGGLIEDYSLVSFRTLAIESKESMYNLLKVIDKTNGYIFADLDKSVELNTLGAAVASSDMSDYERNLSVQEQYVPSLQSQAVPQESQGDETGG